MPLSAVLAGTAAIGGAVSAISSSNAANAQVKAAKLAQKTQMDMFNTSKGELQPFIDTGTGALSALSGLSGAKGSDAIQATLDTLPGYQFAKQQGLEATQNGFAARGLGTSGAALKGAANYVTGLANTNYNNYFEQLLQTAQLGSGAASSLAGNATATGQGIASSQIGAGNAQAAGDIGIGNAISGAFNNAGSSYLLSTLLQNNGFNFSGSSDSAGKSTQNIGTS